eukprot:GFUD01018759.1.p1 GENE.GFUD01018759.1~~GFUD01018759.1.p1  ORF type:complete len:433 (+),score=126.12 GFUD01018759.1:88-1386(+)
MMMMSPVLHSVLRTLRTSCIPIWQITSCLHTSHCLTATDETSVKIKAKLKTPSFTQNETPAVCSIMECEDHRTIKQELDTQSLTDILVGHILSQDIRVHKVSLDFNPTIFREKLISLARKEFSKKLSQQIKVGRFSIANDEIIRSNWNKLITEVNLKEEEVIKELFKHTVKDNVLGLKKNIVGYFLAQGLADVRLATDVYQRARVLICAKKGPFSPEEDQIILDFIEKEGKNWARLSTLLGRTHRSGGLKNRYEFLNYKTGRQSGYFTAREDETILIEVFEVNKNILEDGNIAKKDWQQIGNKLQRPPATVTQHWKTQLEPMLKRYHAGTLSIDLREVLINHLVEHKLDYAQEVDWKKLVKLPKFAGTTPAYLQQMLGSMQICAGRMYPQLSQVELTTVIVQRYLNTKKRTNKQKKLIYQEELIEFYKSNIL